jgi:hypothetical protein
MGDIKPIPHAYLGIQAFRHFSEPVAPDIFDRTIDIYTLKAIEENLLTRCQG